MKCRHELTETILMDSGPHYAKTLCRLCGAFIRWEKNPATLERMASNQILLGKLEGIKVTAWEREFLSSQDKSGKMSPKQQETFNKIVEKYGI